MEDIQIKKKYFYLIVILLLHHPIYCQDKILLGNVVDDLDFPIEFINISVSTGDSILSTTLTDSLGIYKIQFSHPNETFTLKASSWGVEIYSEDVTFVSNSYLNKNIKLKETHGITLKEIEIKAHQTVFKRKNDRYIYQPEASVLKSSTAFDVLKQTPMLKVDDNDISLMFKENTQIYLNNKPQRMSKDALISYLKSMPSDNIKNIELITNPGSQYDASSIGGIVNIVIDKNKNESFLGRLAFRDMQGVYNSQLATFSFEFKKNKLALQGSVTGNNNRNRPKQVTEIVENNGNGQYIRYEDDNKYKGLNFNLNAEYTLSEKHTLNFFTTNRISFNKGYGENYTDYENIISQDMPDSTVLTNIYRDGETKNIFLNLNYLYKIDKKGQQLDISTDYMNHHREEDQYTYFYLVKKNSDLIDRNQLFTYTLQDIQSFSVKTDYIYPSDKCKVNAGGLYTYYKTDSHNDIKVKDNNILFNYEEYISALYTSIDYQCSEKITITAGVRAEHTKINFNLTNLGTEKNHSDYFKIYPSFFFSYNINNKWMLYYSFSSKVKRPTSWELNPFISYSNENTYASGNPNLEKIYFYNQELTLLLDRKYSLNLSFAHSQNDIGQFFVPDQNNPQLNYYGFFNYGDRNNVYINFNIPIHLFNNFWKINLNPGVQYSYYKIGDSELKSYYKNTSSVNGIFYLNNTFNLSQRHSLWAYLNCQYFSPNMYLVKKNIAYPSFNIELKKNWTDWTVSLLGNYGIHNGKGISRLESNQNFAPYSKELYTIYPDFNYLGIRLTYSFGNAKIKVNNNTKIANKDIQMRVQ